MHNIQTYQAVGGRGGTLINICPCQALDGQHVSGTTQQRLKDESKEQVHTEYVDHIQTYQTEEAFINILTKMTHKYYEHVA